MTFLPLRSHTRVEASRVRIGMHPPRVSTPSPLAVVALILLWATCCARWGAAAPVGTCLTGAAPFPIATECAKGFYCPLFNSSDASTVPAVCSPSLQCSLDRLASKFCEAQGTYEPILCEEGYVCPTPVERFECPSGYFCPQGSYQAHPCPPLATCPSGSRKPFMYGSIVAVLLTDALLVILFLGYRHWHARHIRLRDAQYAVAKRASLNQFDRDAPAEELPAHIQLLCNGFRLAQQALPPVQLKFDNLSLRIPAQDSKPAKTVLAGVTGSIQPGSVTAIMGPSGAGKTTFLNTMMDKIEHSWDRAGTLLINGEQRELGEFRKVVGYVPQEDTMHRDLSVYENIKHSAATRLPRTWTARQIEDHVNAVVLAVQLAHVQDTAIGDETTRGVSGGQRKRVNIGMELAAAPALLLLDEPTSGLDSTSAMDICHMLKDLAHTCSLTVAMVIHQPRLEIWESLDELLLLAPGGRTVYQGPQKLAVRYFERTAGVHINANENPADALMDHIAEQGDLFVTLWQQGGRERLQEIKLEAKMNSDATVSSSASNDGGTDHKQPSDASALASASALPSSAAGPDVVIRVQPKSATSSAECGVEMGVIEEIAGNPSDGRLHLASGPKKILGGYPASYATMPSFPAGQLRSTASIPWQVLLTFRRSARKQALSISSLVIEVAVGMLAALIMASVGDGTYQGVFIAPYTTLSPSPLETVVTQLAMFIAMGISLAAASAGVRVFGDEQVVYWREAASGQNRLAYYLGVTLAQIPRNFISGLHFSFIYHLIAQPLIRFEHFLPLAFLLFYCVYGLGALISMLVARTNAALVSVVVALILSVFNGYVTTIPFFLKVLSGAYWSTEAFFDKQTAPFRDVMQVRDISAPIWGFRLDWYEKDLALVFIVGTGYRILAYLAMILLNRSKQR